MSTFEIKAVPLAQIGTDSYQRDLKDDRVDKIVNNFDLAQWNLPKVVEAEDGSFRAVAGKHRCQVARIMLAAGDWPFKEPPGMLLCQVVGGLNGLQGEAQLFIDDANNTANLTPFDKHHAGLIALDPMAIAVEEACTAVGIPVVKRQRTLNGSTISCIGALNMIYRAGGRSLLDETMAVIHAWPATDPYRCFNYLVGGLGMAIADRQMTGKWNRLRFITRMNKPSRQPTSLHAKAHRIALGTTVAFNSYLPFKNAVETS